MGIAYRWCLRAHFFRSLPSLCFPTLEGYAIRRAALCLALLPGASSLFFRQNRSTPAALSSSGRQYTTSANPFPKVRR